MERGILEGNELLAALPGEELESLGSHLEVVSLRFKEILFEQDVTIQHVYFPIRASVNRAHGRRDGRPSQR